MENLKQEFHNAVMANIQIMAKEYNYRPTVFLDMINKSNAVAAVKQLINSNEVPYGYTKLWELNALELSMENLVQKEKWTLLFTDEELKKARKRLKDYGFYNS